MVDVARAMNTPLPGSGSSPTPDPNYVSLDEAAEIRRMRRVAQDRKRRKAQKAAKAKPVRKAAAPAPKKRRRGRPPGAKNKPRLPLDTLRADSVHALRTQIGGEDTLIVFANVMRLLGPLPSGERQRVVKMLSIAAG